jgi:hypothetical protein
VRLGLEVWHGAANIRLKLGAVVGIDWAGSQTCVEVMLHLARGKVHSHKAVGAKPARALVIYTPAGLENFLYEAGTPVADPNVVPAVPDMSVIEKIVGIASKHGIEVPS